jgi:class 3 adenylate cyclase
VTELPSGTVTFLFTDIEGSTGLLKALGRDRYGEVLADQERLLRAAFAAHQGQVVDTQGESVFVAFRTAADAVAAAVDAQRDLAAHPWPDGAEVKVRMGCTPGSRRWATSGMSGSASTARRASAPPATAARCCSPPPRGSSPRRTCPPE